MGLNAPEGVCAAEPARPQESTSHLRLVFTPAEVEAVNQIIVRSSTRKARALRRFADQTRLAEDLAQEAWVAVLNCRPVDGPKRLNYYSKAQRRAVLRAADRQITHARRFDCLHDEAAVVDPSSRPETHGQGLDLGRWLEALPPRLKNIVEYLLQGFSQRQVAKKLGLTQQRVSQLVEILKRDHVDEILGARKP